MTDSPSSNSPTEPRRTAAISSGKYSSGSVFRLVREIRGSAYSVGDEFILAEQQDCFNPSVLRLGGVGENYFADPSGRPLKIEAGDKQIDSIFEEVKPPSKTADILLEEVQVIPPPNRYLTEKDFTHFRKGLAEVLREISAVDPERGTRGTRGFQGVQGDKGDKGDTGETGVQGLQGDTGLQGETGAQGEKGEQGEKGDSGERGLRGETGLQGERGADGADGSDGAQGLQGVRGADGKDGVDGKDGADGVGGADGVDGKNGADGADGADGKNGVDGKNGADGVDGKRGAKGDKGDTGKSGVIAAKFPLVYDSEEQTISIDEARLDAILKKIFGGSKVSPQDMGWLASTGGGGKVAVYINGSKITPDVRTLDFVGAGVTASKVGGKVTVNFTSTGGGSSGGVVTVNGLSGALGITGGTDISVVPSGQTLTINYTGTSVSNVVTSVNGATGAFFIYAGAGITFTQSGNGISFGVIFNNGGATFEGKTASVGTDYVLLQTKPSGGVPGTMYVATVATLLSTVRASPVIVDGGSFV